MISAHSLIRHNSKTALWCTWFIPSLFPFPLFSAALLVLFVGRFGKFGDAPYFRCVLNFLSWDAV